tara:strand:+ start:4247 stop:6442 length:2196 start_codon:yes stop_codon:yes gene_type:complete
MAEENQDMQKAQGFVTWADDSGKQQALVDTSDNIDHYDGIQKTVGYRRRSFLDLETNRSVRVGFTREDYNRFRSEEAVPHKQKEAIQMCMAAYDKVGIIRNVIDLMSDFASQGINLVHPNKRIEKFYRKWFQKINGKERSERFLNTLYRCGNVIVKRRTAKISKKAEKELRSAGSDMSIQDLLFNKREIPWKFDFLNPLSIEVVGNELATFVGQPKYALKVSKVIRQQAKRGIAGTVPYNAKLSAVLPPDIIEAIKTGKELIPLDENKVSAYFYKKDDWLVWANPMIYAILDDIVMLEKMKLADISALDGAISNIRLWSLGDLDNKILPTKNAINKLRNILASNVGGGTMDLVWGPELKFTESSTQVYRFLGKEKYDPVLTNIYAGLGIPPTLTGMASGGGGSFTNNFISLKTLVERLEYGRDVLVSWLNTELEIVRKAMGFRLPATIHFDQMVLADESSEKNLLIQLADRNIVSAETVVERFGEIPEIEKIRIKREERERKGESMPQKAGPYHNPQHKNDIEKIALQKGDIGAEDLGIIPSEETGPHPFTNPEDRVSREVKDEAVEEEMRKQQQREKEFDPVGRPEDGRPKNARDQVKRKQKEVLPRETVKSDFVNLLLWTNDAQKTISEIVHPAILAHYNKKNLRALNKQQSGELEYIKLCVLCNLKPYEEINAGLVNDILKSGSGVNQTVAKTITSLKSGFIKTNKRSPNIDERKQMSANAYASFHTT